MGADWPEDGEQPPDEHPDRQDDRNDPPDRPPPTGNPQAETRSREEAYSDLRVSVSKEESASAQHVTAEEQAAYEEWQGKASDYRWMWGEYQRRWPPEERPTIDRSNDPEGSWRGEGDRYLSVADNERVDAACDQIADRGRNLITPALRAIEGQDPDRQLVGLKNSLKDRDRIKEKVCDKMEEFNWSTEEAVSQVSDIARYTLRYRESHYTEGVWGDITRLKDAGFELHKLTNSWSSDEYKGINSQWVEPNTGQRFELQFHTRISFEAKQQTHDAYKRLRTDQADSFEEVVLKAYQREVSAAVPIPPGATDIPDYSKRGADVD